MNQTDHNTGITTLFFSTSSWVSLNLLFRVQRLGLRFNGLILEDARVKQFADVRLKAEPFHQLF